MFLYTISFSLLQGLRKKVIVDNFVIYYKPTDAVNICAEVSHRLGDFHFTVLYAHAKTCGFWYCCIKLLVIKIEGIFMIVIIFAYFKD